MSKSFILNLIEVYKNAIKIRKNKDTDTLAIFSPDLCLYHKMMIPNVIDGS